MLLCDVWSIIAVMSPDEYRRIRKNAGLTQMQLAPLLGVVPLTVCRRERGRYPITKEAGFALRYVVTHYRKVVSDETKQPAVLGSAD